MKSMASCARCSGSRRGGGVAELVNAIERHIFSRFRVSALGLAVGDLAVGLGGREQQQAGGAWVGNTPGGVIGWGSGAGMIGG